MGLDHGISYDLRLWKPLASTLQRCHEMQPFSVATRVLASNRHHSAQRSPAPATGSIARYRDAVAWPVACNDVSRSTLQAIVTSDAHSLPDPSREQLVRLRTETEILMRKRESHLQRASYASRDPTRVHESRDFYWH